MFLTSAPSANFSPCWVKPEAQIAVTFPTKIGTLPINEIESALNTFITTLLKVGICTTADMSRVIDQLLASKIIESKDRNLQQYNHHETYIPYTHRTPFEVSQR